MDNTSTPIISINPHFTQGAGTWSTNTNTNDTYTVTLIHDGTQEVDLLAIATIANASGATDIAGNSDIGAISAPFVLDTEKPSISIVSAVTPIQIPLMSFNVSDAIGTGIDINTLNISFFDGTTTTTYNYLTDNAYFTYLAPLVTFDLSTAPALADGYYTVTIDINDIAGNAANTITINNPITQVVYDPSTTHHYTIDTNAPNLTDFTIIGADFYYYDNAPISGGPINITINNANSATDDGDQTDAGDDTYQRGLYLEDFVSPSTYMVSINVTDVTTDINNVKLTTRGYDSDVLGFVDVIASLTETPPGSNIYTGTLDISPLAATDDYSFRIVADDVVLNTTNEVNNAANESDAINNIIIDHDKPDAGVIWAALGTNTGYVRGSNAILIGFTDGLDDIDNTIGTPPPLPNHLYPISHYRVEYYETALGAPVESQVRNANEAFYISYYNGDFLHDLTDYTFEIYAIDHTGKETLLGDYDVITDQLDRVTPGPTIRIPDTVVSYHTNSSSEHIQATWNETALNDPDQLHRYEVFVREENTAYGFVNANIMHEGFVSWDPAANLNIITDGDIPLELPEDGLGNFTISNGNTYCTNIRGVNRYEIPGTGTPPLSIDLYGNLINPDDECEDVNAPGGSTSIGSGGGGGGGGGGGTRSTPKINKCSSRYIGSLSIHTREDALKKCERNYISNCRASYINNLGGLKKTNQVRYCNDRYELFSYSLEYMEASDIDDSADIFPDLAKNSKARSHAVKLKKIGIINGYANGNFGPDNNFTRAEMVKVALGLMGEIVDANKRVNPPFPDVNAITWQGPYIAKAKELGIINGYANGNFGPNNKVTKAEASKMLFRAIGYIPTIEEPESVLDSAKYILKSIRQTIDNPIRLTDKDSLPEWSKPYIQFGLNNKIINNNGKYNPNQAITRSEAIIYASMGYDLKGKL